MKTIIALLLALFPNIAFAQETYIVNISKDFYGKIYLEQPAKEFSPGWIAIVDKKTNQELIKNRLLS